MPSFDKGSVVGGAPFGIRNYLRSTQDVKTESFTLSAASVATELVQDTAKPQKIVHRGEAMAKITSGPEAGKIGPYQAGATDGRQTAANIVGLEETFLPWQLLEHDVEVSVSVEARVVQAWCTERDAAGARIPLSNTTATAMVGQKTLSFLFS